jgi:hypothetical protein
VTPGDVPWRTSSRAVLAIGAHDRALLSELAVGRAGALARETPGGVPWRARLLAARSAAGARARGLVSEWSGPDGAPYSTGAEGGNDGWA